MKIAPPCAAPLVSIAGASALAFLSPNVAHAAQGGGFSIEPMIVAAADANGDGAVDAEEWRAFSDPALAGEGDARRELVLRVISAWLDVDGDGAATSDDIEQLLDEGASFTSRLALDLLVEAADTNGDGTLQEDERAALLAAARASTEELLRSSIEEIKASGVGDRSALTPAVVLLTLNGALDVDRDRALTEADLARLFADLDANSDGVVSAAERSPRGRVRGQGGPAGPAPDRSKPPLVPWQRSLEDAFALSSTSGKPLLICVNMDGEAASESLAWGRYRDPAFAELMDGFVALLVSPDRHGPIDRDDRGRRLVDPRFGRVIESEHIGHEPTLYERYFNGTRVAPRHVGVAPSGEILFDVYLVGDLREVDQVLEQHGVHESPIEPAAASDAPAGAGRPGGRPGGRRGGRRGSRFDFGAPLSSPDAGDRDLVEASFVDGDWRLRFELANQSLLSSRRTQHPELLRMALRDPDLRVQRAALRSATRELARVPADLLPEVLRASQVHPVLHGTLVASLWRLSRSSRDDAVGARAARLAATFDGLEQPSNSVDLEAWRAALAGVQRVEEGLEPDAEVALLVEEIGEYDLRLADSPGDGDLLLRKAGKLARLARVQLNMGRDPSIALEDARASAIAAEKAGTRGGRAAGILAFVSYQESDIEGADAAAARALPRLVGEASSQVSAEALHVLALTATRAVYGAMGAGEPIAPEWVSDVHAAYEVLLVHPRGTEAQAIEYLGFLDALEAWAAQDSVVRVALESFPASATLHVWLRGQLLRDQGAAAVEAEYEARLTADTGSAEEQRAATQWYAALAHLVAAERRVGNREPQEAEQDYLRAAALFRSAAELQPEFSESAMHYVCLARAGSARLHLEAQRWDEAVRALREALAARPESAGTNDGLGGSPARTARELLNALAREGRREESQRLREELGAAGVDLSRERGR